MRALFRVFYLTMRTIDPCLWSTKVKKKTLDISRPYKFGVRQSQFEVRLRASFKDTIKEFCSNCSLKGLRLVTDHKRRMAIRRCYLLLKILSIAVGISAIVVTIKMYGERSHLIVNDLMLGQSLHDVTFPAVAICSYNVISNSALNSYARYLYALDRNRTFTIADIKKNLLAFAAILTNTLMPFNPHFMRYLAVVARETNVTKIMYKLAPNCESLLIRCSWHARNVRCERLFAARVTPLGFCCVFNSKYLPDETNNRVYKPKRTGAEAGLRVVVRENTDDFAYVRRPGSEIQVLLFDGREYPLLVAGVVSSYMVQRNTTAYFRIRKRKQFAGPSLVHTSSEERGCRLSAGYDGEDVDSWSKCLARCQRDAAVGLCGCAPFTLPPYGSSVAADCSLEHLACLAKHREKFMYLYPGEFDDMSLSEEAANSLECVGPALCLPDCAHERYSADVVTLPHHRPYSTFRDKFVKRLSHKKGLELANTTAIRLFYTSKTLHLTVFETHYFWFETISYLSAQQVCLVSVTVIGCAELIYHCTVRWAHHYRRRQLPADLAGADLRRGLQ